MRVVLLTKLQVEEAEVSSKNFTITFRALSPGFDQPDTADIVG
jgi:hypothetical protein